MPQRSGAFIPKFFLALAYGDTRLAKETGWDELIKPRRLLNHTAGLDAHGVGTFLPGTAPDIEEALLFDGISANGVEPINEPQTVFEYSGGGYVAAEHILELTSGASFKTYLRDRVLTPYGLNASTYDLATSTTANLARGCSRDTCTWDVKQTKLKAAGGLLTTVRDYARFAILMGNFGVDPATGAQVIQRDNVETALTPVSHKDSSLAACSTPGAVSGLETCVAGKWRRLILDGTSPYGLGVYLTGNVRSDGYHHYVSHGGDQDGFNTYFEYYRGGSGKGIVVMVNGNDSWQQDGYTYGGDAFVDEIMDAYRRHY